MNITIKNPKSVTMKGNKVAEVEFSKRQLLTALRQAKQDPDADLYEPKMVKELLRRGETSLKNLDKLTSAEDFFKEMGIQ